MRFTCVRNHIDYRRHSCSGTHTPNKKCNLQIVCTACEALYPVSLTHVTSFGRPLVIYTHTHSFTRTLETPSESVKCDTLRVRARAHTRECTLFWVRMCVCGGKMLACVHTRPGSRVSAAVFQWPATPGKCGTEMRNQFSV